MCECFFFWRHIVKSLSSAADSFQFTLTFSCMAALQVSIPLFLQLDHSRRVSLLFCLLEDMVSCSLFPALLHMAPVPPIFSHCLSGSHGPTTKAVGGGQWNNPWHPYGLHFPDRNAVAVLMCVSICVTREEKKQKRTCRARERKTERGMELLNKTVVRKKQEGGHLHVLSQNCLS